MNTKLFKITKISLLLIAFISIMISCKSDDDLPVEENDPTEENDIPAEEGPRYKTTGYVISSQSTNAAGSTYFFGYNESKPTGNIDLSAFNSGTRFTIDDSSNGFLYGRPFDNGLALTKFGVDEVTEEVEVVAEIITSARAGNTTIINDELGFYTVTGENLLYLFNPSTMELIRSISLSGAFSPTIEHFTHFISSAYRAEDNKVFLFANINDASTGAFYDANTVYVEVVNLDTFSWESSSSIENAQYPFNRGYHNNNLVDELGNIYITCQGSYGLDGQVGPTASIGSRPQILKIPAGSTEFDTNYRFNPVNTLGFPNLIAQFFTGFRYYENGIAYAAVSATNDSARILELVQKLGLGTISTEENIELQNLVLNSPTSKWTKLDLNAQAATVIDGLPFIAGFGFAASTIDGENILLQTYNPDEGVNGFYEHNLSSGASSSLYNITGGGIGAPIYKLGE